jgi:hypothetical protein
VEGKAGEGVEESKRVVGTLMDFEENHVRPPEGPKRKSRHDQCPPFLELPTEEVGWESRGVTKFLASSQISVARAPEGRKKKLPEAEAEAVWSLDETRREEDQSLELAAAIQGRYKTTGL